MRLTAVVGNPKSRSRTYGIAEQLLRHIASNGAGIEPADVEVIDLADYAPALLQWGSASAARLTERVRASDLVVFASPTYKATYTGLLKLFLDQLPPQALAGVVAVPVMVGGTPHHSLAVEAYMRPLLVETGAICPTRGLYVIDSQLDGLPAAIDEWYEASAQVLGALAVGKGA